MRTLQLLSAVGRGQRNEEDDVEALDGSLRAVNAYAPPPEYAGQPQRFATEPMIDALERFQEQKGIKIDGYALPGGPTERAINNELLDKPAGAGLLYDPIKPIADTVGNGFKNERDDVRSIQRALGALGYMPEDPFDRPHGLIDEQTTNAIEQFQRDEGLASDGWLAPRGETEAALYRSLGALRESEQQGWQAYAERAKSTATDGPLHPQSLGTGKTSSGDQEAESPIVPVFQTQNPLFPGMWPILEGGYRRPGGGGLSGGLRRPTPPVGNPDTPQQDPDDGSAQYVPSPGDVLAIPLIRAHRFGNRGKPETRAMTGRLNEKIAKACKEALPDGKVEIVGGPVSPDDIEGYHEHRSDKRDYDTKGAERLKKGYALIDGTIAIRYGDIYVWIHNNTHDARADGTMTPREDRQFAKVKGNEINRNAVHVLVPKPREGEELDTDALIDFAKKLCEQIKKEVDEGLYSKENGGRELIESFRKHRKKAEPAAK